MTGVLASISLAVGISVSAHEGAVAPSQPSVRSTAIEWTAPAACPDLAAMTTAVERYIARPLADEVVSARGVITSRAGADGAGALELTLVVVAPDAVPLERKLVDRDCAVLAEAAALTIAIAIDPEAAERAVVPVDPPPEPEPEPTPLPAPEPEPEPTAPEVTTPVADPRPERSDATKPPRRCDPKPGRRAWPPKTPCVVLGADVGFQVGTLPRVGPSVGGHVALAWRRLLLELGALHHFGSRSVVARNPDKGGEIALTHATLVACARLGARRFELPLCGGAELGAFTGSGFGVSDPATARVPWIAARFGAGALWAPVRRFAFGARVDGAVALVPPRFAVDGLGIVHRPSPVGLRGLGVLELRLP